MASRLNRLWPRRDLWRHGDFLKLWSGQTISQVGSQVSALALPLAAVIVLDASAFEVAMLGTVEFLPFLLFALPAGVWVDRLRRRPILIVTDLLRGLFLASIPVAYLFDALTIWQLYAVGFLVGICTVFFDVSYQSYLPSLVRKDQLVEGNSLLEVSRNAAQIGGPGMAGLLVGAITAPYAVLVDAVSFLGSAGLLATIRIEEQPPPATEKPSMRRELREGLEYLVRHRYWRPISITTASSNFFWTMCGSIIIVYAVRELDLSPAVIGLTFSLGSIGGLLGAFIGRPVSARFGVGPTIVASAVLFGPALMLVPLAPQSFPIPLLVASFILAGAGAVLYNISAISLMQTLTPERLLGRLNASRRFIVWGTIPLGSLTGGALASVIGLHATLWVGAIGASVCFIPVALSPLRHIHDMPTDSEQDPNVPLAPPGPASAAADA
jgi:MFS family permease